MTPASYVATAVLARLQSVSIPGIKPEEIVILPEGQAPPSMGERHLIISLESTQTVRTDSDYRGKMVLFKVHHIQCMRAIPNDRQGILYTNENEVNDAQETIEDAIQSIVMFNELQTLVETTQTEDVKQKKFSISRAFIHRMTTLNPIHLYPGWFHAKPSSEDSKIAGYRHYQSFQSPVFFPINSPLTCS
jgi:hypothetical protein